MGVAVGECYGAVEVLSNSVSANQLGGFEGRCASLI